MCVHSQRFYTSKYFYLSYKDLERKLYNENKKKSWERHLDLTYDFNCPMNIRHNNKLLLKLFI